MKHLYPKPIKKDGIWCWLLEDDNTISMTPTEEAIFNWLEERVKWLLKKIEKEEETIRNPSIYGEGVFDGLEIAKDLIKKAFSGVIEE